MPAHLKSIYMISATVSLCFLVFVQLPFYAHCSEGGWTPPQWWLLGKLWKRICIRSINIYGHLNLCIFWVHFYLTDFLFPWTFFAHSFACQQLGRHRVVWASSHSASVERRILTLVSVHLFSLSLVSGHLFLWFKSGHLFLCFFDLNPVASFFPWFKFYSICWIKAASLISNFDSLWSPLSLILWFKSSHLFLSLI